MRARRKLPEAATHARTPGVALRARDPGGLDASCVPVNFIRPVQDLIHHFASTTSSPRSITFARLIDSAISSALNDDFTSSALPFTTRSRAISVATKTPASCGACARSERNSRWPALRKFRTLPSGSNTTPPASVICSEASRITKRSPAKMNTGSSKRICAMAVLPARSSSLVWKKTRAPKLALASFTARRRRV